MENGSTKYLSQLENYSRGENKIILDKLTGIRFE